MKALIITFHFVNNFGGALQAYALQKVLEKNCCSDVQIINYRNNFIEFTDFVRLFPVSRNIAEIFSGLMTMKLRFKRVKKFECFHITKLKLSLKKYNDLNINFSPPKADIYICGSDQIWNPFLTFGIRSSYFLGFVKNHGKRISYAPSFGSKTLPSIFHPIIRKYLQRFDAVSVREKSGQKIVRDLCGISAEQLIDPTFLLEKSDWEKVAVKPDIKGPYILLYIMQSDQHMYEYARKIKERLELPVVEISRYGYRPDFIDTTIVDIGPAEFLGLFQHASYVCTNSYHGFIFSLIFEKPFCLIPSRRFRTRIYNLADLLKMEIKDTTVKEAADMIYNKDNVRKVIEAEREHAIAWLCEKIQKTG